MTTEIRWSFPLWTSNLQESRFSRILENFFHISPLDLDLEAFQFHFHFSKRVKSKINSLFISRKEWKGKWFHFSFLKKVKAIKISLFFSREKEWNHISATVHFGRFLMLNTKKCNKYMYIYIFYEHLAVWLSSEAFWLSKVLGTWFFIEPFAIGWGKLPVMTVSSSPRKLNFHFLLFIPLF